MCIAGVYHRKFKIYNTLCVLYIFSLAISNTIRSEKEPHALQHLMRQNYSMLVLNNGMLDTATKVR